MEFKDVIDSRYSVRKFSQKPVEDEVLQQILEAGRLAPTAKNMQGQHVYVVKSPEMRAKFEKEWAMTFDAPIVLIIAMKQELEWISHFSKLNRGETDAAIVTDEMMLQAHALGLGTCWVGWFDPQKVKEVFDLPENETVYNLLPLGYPADDCKPGPLHASRKPLSETVTFL
ncbi:MAG: nitroreductase [Thermoplasmata archaeon]|nr:nitroreductase [Thermoplasmata archaeon]